MNPDPGGPTKFRISETTQDKSVVAVVEQERERNHTITQTHLGTGCIITRVHVHSGAHVPRRFVARLELFRCTNIGTENAPSWRDMERKRESVQ